MCDDCNPLRHPMSSSRAVVAIAGATPREQLQCRVLIGGAMSVLLVFVFAGVVAAALAAIAFKVVNRDASSASHGPVHATADAVQTQLVRHRSVARFVRNRLSPASATG